MPHINLTFRFAVFVSVLLSFLVGCTPNSPVTPLTSTPLRITKFPATATLQPTQVPKAATLPLILEAPITVYSPTPAPDLTVAPELLFTPTPDLNALSITTEIEPNKTKEEITKILLSKWLDRYLSNNMSLEMRLDDYAINKITIPHDQSCASKLGAIFITEAEVTAKTTMPSHAPPGSYSSRWIISAGGLISENATQRTILFKSAVSKIENEYTLTVIVQVPLC